MPDGCETAHRLREQAARCRRLAAAVTDDVVTRRLLELAVEFDEQADKVEARTYTEMIDGSEAHRAKRGGRPN